METKNAKTKVVVGLLALVGMLAYTLTGIAGNPEPSGPPAPTMKMLDEICAAVSSRGDAACQVSGTEFAADDRSFIAMQVFGIPGSGVPGVPGLEDASNVLDVEHSITVPFDSGTGMATGVRVHSPFRVVKNIDKATPGLHFACATGRRLTTVIFDVYRIDPATDQEVAYYKITLRNALVVDIGPTTNFVTPDSYRHMERVSFVYEEIEWNWQDSIIEQDRWTAPGGG